MIWVDDDQKMLSDVPNVIRAQHQSWTNLVLKAEIYLPGTRRAVAGIEQIEAVRGGGIQSGAHEIRVRLRSWRVRRCRSFEGRA